MVSPGLLEAIADAERKHLFRLTCVRRVQTRVHARLRSWQHVATQRLPRLNLGRGRARARASSYEVLLQKLRVLSVSIRHFLIN